MSDALILGLAGAAFIPITALLTIWLNGSVARKSALQAHQFKIELSAQIAAESKSMKDDIKEVKSQTEVHHKEIDGKLSRLLELEKKLSFSEGEKQGQANQIILDKGKQPVVTYTKEKGGADKDKAIKHMDQAKDEIDEAKDQI